MTEQTNRLKYRMYFFVPYNISPIQQAIQAGHAALEYAYKYRQTKEYKSFIENDKTWIILNGGTTNSEWDENGVSIGTLNQIRESLRDNKIDNSTFIEPDLNNALTAICFLADERVWDYETYPDFRDYLISIPITYTYYDDGSKSAKSFMSLTFEELKNIWPNHYTVWETIMGGQKNVFLRNLLKGKKLA